MSARSCKTLLFMSIFSFQKRSQMRSQPRGQAFGLILAGVGRRLVFAACIVMALWALFFWATSAQAGL